MKKLVFIYGGPSDEHDISKLSFKNINSSAKKIADLELDNIYLSKSANKIFSKIKLDSKALYWPIIHGNFGEDGQIQKILEKKGLSYVGNSSIASSLSFDKYLFAKFLGKFGIQSPKTISVNKLGKDELDKIKNFTFPIFVKPNNNGSSVGLLKIESDKNLDNILKKHVKKHGEVLVQEFVDGREFTCGVLHRKNNFVPLVPTEIVLNNNEVFDYKNKYLTKKKIEITPPVGLNKKILNEVQKLALKCHRLAGLGDYSRTDIILTKEGKLVVLETNSVPGLTKNSLYPQQLEKAGVKLGEFVKIMIDNHK